MQLIVEKLVQLRGGRTVIDHLSFDVDPGDVGPGAALVLTGTNGSGKTTLLRALAGFLRPESGTISLRGSNAERTLAEQCHYVGHLNGVKPTLTVGENISFWAEYLGGAPNVTAKALDRLGLQALADIPAGYLSAGQKRRLALARLLVAERPVWLLDEPTVSLDAAASKLLAGLVNAHTGSGGIAVVATHLPLGLERSRELRLGGVRAAA